MDRKTTDLNPHSGRSIFSYPFSVQFQILIKNSFYPVLCEEFENEKKKGQKKIWPSGEGIQIPEIH